jgi:hypothetical protein
MPVIRGRQLLLTFGQQSLQTEDAIISGNQLALRNGNFLLQTGVLLHELSLHDCQLLEVALKERHLLLLLTIVAAAENVVVLLSCLIEGDFELHHSLAAILQIAHQILLHQIEVGYLLL